MHLENTLNPWDTEYISDNWEQQQTWVRSSMDLWIDIFRF